MHYGPLTGDETRAEARADAAEDAVAKEVAYLRLTRSWLVRALSRGEVPDALHEALADAWFPGAVAAPAESEWEAAALFDAIPEAAADLYEAFLVATAERRLGL